MTTQADWQDCLRKIIADRLNFESHVLDDRSIALVWQMAHDLSTRMTTESYGRTHGYDPHEYRFGGPRWGELEEAWLNDTEDDGVYETTVAGITLDKLAHEISDTVAQFPTGGPVPDHDTLAEVSGVKVRVAQ